VAIIVMGLVGTALAVSHRRTNEEVAPTTEDHWHEAFGVYVCGEFLPNQSPVVEDSPITLNSDGLINIEPKDEKSAGANATFGIFLQTMGITVTPESFTLSDGTTHTNGEDCDGKEARVALYVWPPQAGENTDPRIVTSSIETTRFTDDGQSYVLAFNPRDDDVPLPPSQANLEDPSDKRAPVATTTTVAGGDAGADASGEEPAADGDEPAEGAEPGATEPPQTTVPEE
jgi:hypothetical protein